MIKNSDQGTSGEQSSSSADCLPTPNAGELDVLAVLWEEGRGTNYSLQLSEVYRRVCARRRKYQEAEPALTTVSTHLRSLTAKGLLEEVTAARPGAAQPATGRAVVRVRGAYRPPTRSPLTSYRALHEPGSVLAATYYGLAEAYPPDRRLDALLDFATALELSEAALQRLRQFVAEEKKAQGKPLPPVQEETAG
jgi:predicted transcriptional regulator